MNRPFILLLLALLTSLGVNASPRKTCIDKDWQFRYEDGTWRQLNLPHDWGVDTDAAIYSGKKHIGPFVKEASDYQRAYILGGTGWYKKTLVLSPEDADKLITLYFDVWDDMLQCLLRARLASAKDNHIVCVSHKAVSSAFQFMVKFIEHDVCTQRTQWPALRYSHFGFFEFSAPYDSCPKIFVDKR